MRTLVKKLSIATALILIMTPGVHAADGEKLYTSKGCGSCHGADGTKPTVSSYPKVAGQSLEYLVQQMKDIKSGARSNGQSIVMKGIMAAVSDDEIKAIAEYLSSQG